MQFKLGLKLWSNSILYLPDAIKLHNEGLYDYIELYIVPRFYKKMIASFKNLQIPFVIHCTHESHDFNLALKAKEKQNLEIFKEVYKYANDLKAEKIIVHAGSNGNIKESKRQLKLLNDSRILLENASFILNSFHFHGSTFEEVNYLLQDERIGFCFDITHAKCTARNLKVDPILYLKKFSKLNPSIYHLSGGKYDEKFDQHLHLSESDYPWDKILSLIKIGSLVTVETDKNKKDSLDDFKKDLNFLNNDILFRKASKEDEMFLYNLRNEASSRMSSFNTKLIDLDQHKEWFKNKLKDKNSLILIAENNFGKIGQLRFDKKNNKEAEVSISIVSEFRGQGYGTLLLKKGCEYVFKKLDINKIVAHIKPENKVSIQTFAKAGFTKSGIVVFNSQPCLEMHLLS